MIQKDTILFLKKLKNNNNKEWFDKNRSIYAEAKKDVELFVEQMIKQITVFDKKIIGLDPKKCMFRINRDVRFSNDKSPYKTNIGASINPGGKKSMIPGYYLHLEPNNSFIAGGIYMPPAETLAAVRQEIDYNAEEFKKLLTNKEFKKYFSTLDNSDKLKTAPKGYPKDHPEIELLKHKSYIVVHEIKDDQLFKKDFTKHSIQVCKAMYPFLSFLRRSLD